MFKKIRDMIKEALSKNKQYYTDSIIRNEKGQILLLQRSYQDGFQPGKWCLPGGKVEEGEQPSIAAKRELEEETGLQVELTYLDKVERKDDVSLYYEGFVYSATATILDNREHYRLQWVDLQTIKDYDLILDLGNILLQLPLTAIDTRFLHSSPIIGEDLYTQWLLKKQEFNNEKITEEQYDKFIKKSKQIAAFELIKRAFDDSLITEDQFATYFNKSNTSLQPPLILSSLCTIEQLVEIVQYMNS